MRKKIQKIVSWHFSNKKIETILLLMSMIVLLSPWAFSGQVVTDLYSFAAESPSCSGSGLGESESVGKIVASFVKTTAEEGSITYNYFTESLDPDKKGKYDQGTLAIKLTKVHKSLLKDGDLAYSFEGFDTEIQRRVSGTFLFRPEDKKRNHLFEIVVLTTSGTLDYQITQVRSDWARKTISKLNKMDFGDI